MTSDAIFRKAQSNSGDFRSKKTHVIVTSDNRVLFRSEFGASTDSAHMQGLHEFEMTGPGLVWMVGAMTTCKLSYRLSGRIWSHSSWKLFPPPLSLTALAIIQTLVTLEVLTYLVERATQTN